MAAKQYIRGSSKDVCSAEVLGERCFSLRRKWAYAFFPLAPTLGIQSTQRNEGWYAKLKSLTSPHMPLQIFVKELNITSSVIGDLEIRDAHCPTRHVNISTTPFIPDKVVEALVQRNITEFSTTMLFAEFDSTPRMSATPPHIERGINDVHVLISSFVSYPIENNVLESQSHPQVQFTVRRGLPGPSGVDETFQWSVACPCHFLVRMQMPCRHVLDFLSCLLRDGQQNPSQDPWTTALLLISRFTGENTKVDLFKRFIYHLVSSRWTHSRTPQPMPSGTMVSRDRTIWMRESLRRGRWSGADTTGPMQQVAALNGGSLENAEASSRLDLDSGSFRYGDFHRSFSVRSNGDGTPAAFGYFMFVSRVVAEELTRDSERLSVGGVLLTIMSNVVSALRELQTTYGKNWPYNDAKRYFLIHEAVNTSLHTHLPASRPLMSEDGSVQFRDAHFLNPTISTSFSTRDEPIA